jgi:hypothetical protein
MSRLNPYQHEVSDYKEMYGSSWYKEFNKDLRRLDGESKKDIARVEYKNKVQELTEQNKLNVVGIESRGYRTYHIDHKISIDYGYRNNIPVEDIAHPSNLHMMWWEDNMEKNVDILIDAQNRWILN